MTTWRLARASYGTLGEWRAAVEDAARTGWTEGQVKAVLWGLGWLPPVSAIVGVLVAVEVLL